MRVVILSITFVKWCNVRWTDCWLIVNRFCVFTASIPLILTRFEKSEDAPSIKVCWIGFVLCTIGKVKGRTEAGRDAYFLWIIILQLHWCIYSSPWSISFVIWTDFGQSSFRHSRFKQISSVSPMPDRFRGPGFDCPIETVIGVNIDVWGDCLLSGNVNVEILFSLSESGRSSFSAFGECHCRPSSSEFEEKVHWLSSANNIGARSKQSKSRWLFPDSFGNKLILVEYAA
jgi:hypothetical protein